MSALNPLVSLKKHNTVGGCLGGLLEKRQRERTKVKKENDRYLKKKVGWRLPDKSDSRQYNAGRIKIIEGHTPCNNLQINYQLSG